MQLNNPVRVKTSLKIFLQAFWFLVTNHLLIFNLLLSFSNPSVQIWVFQPSCFPLVYFPLFSIAVHSFIMAYPSQSSYFNICDNIGVSMKMVQLLIASQPPFSSILDGSLYFPNNISVEDSKLMIQFSVKVQVSLPYWLN